MLDNEQLLSLKEACEWASRYLNKKVSISNISYLIQYGRIKKYGDNGCTYVSLKELKEYYNSLNNNIKNSSDSDINWALSLNNTQKLKGLSMYTDYIHTKVNLFLN